jgi:site-specific DNA-cytosine methylase
MKRVLVACEYSGIVRDAFKEEGYCAISCDLLPTERPGEHYQGDVREILNEGWDLMIAHPPCTYLSNVGIGWFNEEKYGDKARERKRKRLEAFEFIKLLWNAPIPRICIENPVGFLNNNWQKPTQIIQPYHFGDADSKRTCLWLKNLPSLKPTNIVTPTIYSYYKSGKHKGNPIYRTEYIKNQKERSRFFEGIAKAMANQWGELL